MSIKDLNSAYFDERNAHDCAAISAIFAVNGIYYFSDDILGKNQQYLHKLYDKLSQIISL